MAEKTAELLSDCDLKLVEGGEHFSGEGFKSFIKNTVIKNK